VLPSVLAIAERRDLVAGAGEQLRRLRGVLPRRRRARVA
jgi:hypothetical protein